VTPLVFGLKESGSVSERGAFGVPPGASREAGTMPAPRQFNELRATMIFKRTLGAIATVLLLAGCGGEDAGEPSADGVDETPTAEMQGMEGTGDMQSMPGMQMDGGMMEQMQSHMQMMQGAPGDSLMTIMPMHRQMTANMLARMNREMRGMNMTADADWNATVDSLREDLIRMPEMGAAELQAWMPEHGARVERLMEMHRGMMEEM
jgi:hypothetical protein